MPNEELVIRNGLGSARDGGGGQLGADLLIRHDIVWRDLCFRCFVSVPDRKTCAGAAH